MQLNYVIAAWGGPRRSDDPRAIADRTFFLRTHLARLERTSHQLAEITVVVPDNPEEPSAFTAYVAALPYPVIRRPNVGYSYGSYIETFRRSHGRFDGYVFTEDDYVFVEDDFDRELAEIARRRSAGFVCGAVLPHHATTDHPVAVAAHPAIALGLCTSDALERWGSAFDMPCDGERSSYNDAERWQLRWGADFAALGIGLVDWLDAWATPYWTCVDDVRWYGPPDRRPMVVPIQACGREVMRTTPTGAVISAWSADRDDDRDAPVLE
jgi:hypothetical protein